MPTTLMELRHAEMEHRMFITILSLALLANVGTQVMLILQTPTALISKVAIMTGNPMAVACMFAVSAALVIPNTIMTVAWRNRFASRIAVKASVAGFALCSVAWFFLGYSARNLDAEWLVFSYLRNGVVTMSFSAALGVMLNNQMKRRQRVVQLENEKQPTVA